MRVGRLPLHAIALAACMAALCFAMTPTRAAEPRKGGHPDLSGFWMLKRAQFVPDPELVRRVPAGTVEMKDTGAAEFGPMDFGGLKPTPAALAAARAWNPQQEMTVSNACKAPSIVYALQGPFPVEIFQGTEMIVMRLEYFDLARVFFLDGRKSLPADGPHTKTGFSLARWDGDTLEVVTTHLKAATITNNGLEHSDNIRVTERYRLLDDGKTLMASQEYDDPDVLQNRGVRYIAWRRVEGDHVHGYDCDPSFAENYAAP
jgi:hypothetical protein